MSVTSSVLSLMDTLVKSRWGQKTGLKKTIMAGQWPCNYVVLVRLDRCQAWIMRGVRSHMAAGGTTRPFQHVQRNADLLHTFFLSFCVTATGWRRRHIWGHQVPLLIILTLMCDITFPPEKFKEWLNDNWMNLYISIVAYKSTVYIYIV